MLAGGCAGNVLQGEADLPLSVEWQETPFFPQEEYQCGPAALATLLSSSGRSVRPEELVARVYVPGKRGSFQSELLAATRSYERMPYVIPPELPALLAELADGRIVLVFSKPRRQASAGMALRSRDRIFFGKRPHRSSFRDNETPGAIHPAVSQDLAKGRILGDGRFGPGRTTGDRR